MSKESQFGAECPGCGLKITFRAEHHRHCAGNQAAIRETKGWTTNERLVGPTKRSDSKRGKRPRRPNSTVEEPES